MYVSVNVCMLLSVCYLHVSNVHMNSHVPPVFDIFNYESGKKPHNCIATLTSDAQQGKREHQVHAQLAVSTLSTPADVAPPQHRSHADCWPPHHP